jgi:hypothetical protein
MKARLIVVSIALLAHLVAGMRRRLGIWRGSQWLRFVTSLIISAAFVVIALLMAGGVDKGLTLRWSVAARAIYVLAMILMLLYGVVSGVQLLKTFSGDAAPSVWYRGYLFTFAVLSVVLVGASVLHDVYGVPFHRSGAITIGGFSVWLGLRPPQWFDAHGGVQVLQGLLGRSGTRLLYVAVGLLFLLAGIVGWQPGLVREPRSN